MSIDITRLSAKELDALINEAKKRKNTLSRRKPIGVVRQKLTQLAKAEGYTIAELFGGVPVTKSSAKPAGAPSRARKSGRRPRTTAKFNSRLSKRLHSPAAQAAYPSSNHSGTRTLTLSCRAR